MLGLARRAGKLQTGYDATVNAIKAGTVSGVLACEDISEKTYKNLKFEGDRMSVPVIRISTTTALASASVGKKAGIFAVCDDGFYSAMDKMEKINKERVSAESAEKGIINE